MIELALALVLAGRPDSPGSTDLFAFAPGDVVESFDSAGGRFRIHYTRAGVNAVPAADVDADGVPDHVQSVAAIYEQVLDRYTGLGYRAPVDDGDGVFDVYLVDTGFSADGAFSAETCVGKVCSGYMVQENDFQGFNYPSVDYANRLLASHEFFHAVQDAYDGQQGAVLAEGTAVWASEHFDATLGDLELFSADYFASTDRPLNSDGAGPTDPFTYGTSAFWEYLSQTYGDDVILQLWEAVAAGNQHWDELIDGVLANAGATGFADVFVDFAAASARDVTTHTATVPLSEKTHLVFVASFTTQTVHASGPLRLALAADEVKNTDGVRVNLVPLTGTASVVSGALDATIELGDTASDVAVQVINTRLQGNGARPHLCLGSPTDVDACLAAFVPPVTPPVPDPPPATCACTSSPSAAPTTAVLGLVLGLGAFARRRQR